MRNLSKEENRKKTKCIKTPTMEMEKNWAQVPSMGKVKLQGNFKDGNGTYSHAKV